MTIDEMLVLRYGSVRGDDTFGSKLRTTRAGLRLLASGAFVAVGDGCVELSSHGETLLIAHKLRHPNHCEETPNGE